MKLLFADDNHTERVLVRGLAEKWGFDVVLACDGPEALDILEGNDPPRIALLDWMMPEMDGLEVCRQLHSLSNKQPLYCILLTGKSEKADKIAALEAGAHDFLTKPVDPVELRARLNVAQRTIAYQQALLERDRQLEHAVKMEAVGRLAGRVAHDFNNLLTAVSGNVSLAQMDVDPNDPMYELLDEINSAVDRAGQLTNRLLGLSNKRCAPKSDLDLNACLSDLDKRIRAQIGSGVVLKLDPHSRVRGIKGARSQIEQIVDNLVANAVEAMPLGGHLFIETEDRHVDTDLAALHPGAQSGPHVVLSVRDTGTGIGPADLPHIFEPFFSTREDKPKGSGLGLSIVYGMVKQHNGFIEIASTPRKGSKISVYFPGVATSTSDAKAFAAHSEKAPKATNEGVETILLAEDEDIVRQMNTRILQRLGYRVVAAEDGLKAWDVYREMNGGFDLLMTDVVMPHLNGQELFERIKAVRPEAKVLFTSGYTNDVLGQHGILENGINFIPKPYSPELLAKKVREVLDSP